MLNYQSEVELWLKTTEKLKYSLTEFFEIAMIMHIILDCQLVLILHDPNTLPTLLFNSSKPFIATILSVQCGSVPSHHFVLLIDGSEFKECATQDKS